MRAAVTCYPIQSVSTKLCSSCIGSSIATVTTPISHWVPVFTQKSSYCQLQRVNYPFLDCFSNQLNLGSDHFLRPGYPFMSVAQVEGAVVHRADIKDVQQYNSCFLCGNILVVTLSANMDPLESNWRDGRLSNWSRGLIGKYPNLDSFVGNDESVTRMRMPNGTPVLLQRLCHGLFARCCASTHSHL